MGIATLAKQIFEEQSFDDQEFITLIEILVASDELYHNDEEPFLTDNEYDFLRRFAEKLNPSNVYFTGVGSNVRGGKVKLPHKMGSLDQVYEGEIQKWVARHSLTAGALVVLTDKLDGASAMIVYDDNGDLQIGYSRGNGEEGADWTRHLKLLDTVPNNIGKAMTIRGEVIIEKASFRYLRNQVKTRGGKQYKNARNMVSGCMNAKSNPDMIYDYIRFIPYQIVDGAGSKQQQLSILSTLGFEIVYSLCVFAGELNDDSLADHLNLRRQNSLFEIDGLVVDVDDEKKRAAMNPTMDTLNPLYSIKYKVAAAENIAYPTVIDVEWNISKHGYLKPRVNIEAVDLDGVTIEWATGFNAKFIFDNQIGKGAIIELTRSGQVIPFIQRVIEPASKAAMPDTYEWEWTVNEEGDHIDAKLINPEEHCEVALKRITSFFTKIGAPCLKEGSVSSLFIAGYKSVKDIIVAEKHELTAVLGKNGAKIYEGLHKTLSDIPLYHLVGAYSTQRGIGVRRMKKVQTWYDKNQISLLENSEPDIIASIEGFDAKTANAVKRAIDEFQELYYNVEEFITLNDDSLVSSEGGKLDNHKICMTGFRDKDLAEQIEKEGGTVQSGVSGKTTILVTKDPTSNSGKVKKARDLGIQIMGIDEFKGFMNE